MFLVLSCSCHGPIHWSQVASREWRCSWSSIERQSSNYIWVINYFIAYRGAPYIRGLRVFGAQPLPTCHSASSHNHNQCRLMINEVRWHSPENSLPLQWHHNKCDGISNNQRPDCLLNHLFRRRSKKTTKLCVTGLREGNPPVTGGLPHKGPVTHLEWTH